MTLALACCVCALLLSTGAGGAAAWAQTGEKDDQVRSLSIPGGTLETALELLGHEYGVELEYDSAVLEGRTTAGLEGEYAARDALERLLGGSGLRADWTGPGSVRVVPSAMGAETVLPEMTVQGEAIGTHEIPVERIQRNLSRDMADVFRGETSVVVGGGARNAQRVYVRGVDSTNLNVTIDGAKQGGSLHQHRGDIGAIDPILLKRVAVETGSSADSGAGALGGSLRFETVDAQDMLLPGKTEGATLQGGYGSVDKSWQGGASAYAVIDDTYGLLAHFSAADRRDYADGDGHDVPNTAGEDQDYFVKFSMLELQGHSLRLSAESKKDSGLYIWGSTGSDFGSTDDGEPVTVHTERTSLVADHRYQGESPLLDTHINIYYTDNLVENRDGESEYSTDTRGYDLRNTFHLTLGEAGADLTLGTDGVVELHSAETATVDTERESSNYGFFLQNRIAYGPARLSFGARLDSYDAEFGSHSIDGSRISPNVGLEYDLLEALTAFANYGQAVRGSGTLPGSWLPNINAATIFSVESPETSERWEGGLRYGMEEFLFSGDRLKVEVSRFQNRMKNMIVAAGGPGGVIREVYNYDPLLTEGWEASLGWGVAFYDTSLSFTRARTVDDQGDPITITRRLAAPTGDRLVWDNRVRPLDGVTLGYTLDHVARLTDVSNGVEERPGYTLHSVQAQWEPEMLPGLALNLAVHNLLDLRYSEQTSIYSSTVDPIVEPGRDVRLGFTYSF